MLDNNYRYSLDLLRWCQQERVPFVYASSAAVYGLGPGFNEDSPPKPLNVYGYSKYLFDQIVRRELPKLSAPVVGLRYFNVYGPRESHKGRMASVALHHFHQYREHGRVKLFEGSHGYADGDQRRDFVYVDDVVSVNLHFWNQPVSGIYNVGTGTAQPFNDVALTVINSLRASATPLSLEDAVAQGLIEYCAFPVELKHKYQAYTEADLRHLRASGCDVTFQPVEQATASYMRWLLAQTP